MTSASAGSDPVVPLDPGETVLWTGPAGFSAASHILPVLISMVLVAFVFRAAASNDCEGDAFCTGFFWLLPALLLLFLASLLFDVAERLAVWLGRARVRIVLTNRRLVRVSDWPWHRVRMADYVSIPPTPGYSSVLRVGRHNSFVLSQSDARQVMDLIRRQLENAA